MVNSHPSKPHLQNYLLKLFYYSHCHCQSMTMTSTSTMKMNQHSSLSYSRYPHLNMEVQAEFMESSMAGSTSLSTPEGDVNSLMQQVADNYGLEVSVGLPQPAAHAVPLRNTEKVDEDDLSRRLAELKARG